MRATDFEYRNRFWVIAVIFVVAFGCYSVDKRNTGEAIAKVVSRSLSKGAPATRRDVQLVMFLGAILVTLAAVLRTWGSAYLGSSVVHDTALHSQRLVADGPFRHVRNPLYLGNVIMTIGIGLMASRMGWIVLNAGMWLFVRRLIGREERELSVTQGDDFRAYCAVVPRLLFSLWPRIPAGGGRPRWRQAFLGELIFWALTMGMFVFALTLNAVYANILFVMGLVAEIAVAATVKRGAKAEVAQRT
jgi:protein-S-isoprenylcysteine O-methyltransferase Ste14